MAINYQKELRDANAKIRKAAKRHLRDKRHIQKLKRKSRKNANDFTSKAQEAEHLRAENERLQKDIDALRDGFIVLEWRDSND